MRLAALALVAGCGRIDFDPLATTTFRLGNAITVGVSHACAIDADDHLWCWGADYAGQIGDGGTRVATPVQIGTDTWAQISANGITSGQSWTCGIKTDGTLWCWGLDDSGQLGLGTSGTVVRTPAQVGTQSWQQVSVGIRCNTCGIQEDGSLWCWGDSPSGLCSGYVGDGGIAPALSPVEISPESWRSVGVGDTDSCAVKTDGTLWCWGSNTRHALGDGTTTVHELPEQIGSSTAWTSVLASDLRACGMQADGSVWCWGDNTSGVDGDGTTNEITMPKQIGAGTTWTTLVIGMTETCALDLGDSLWCWGVSEEGALGSDVTSSVTSPLNIDPRGWHRIAAGQFATCGIRDDGIFCMGGDDTGILGDGGATRWSPESIDGGWTTLAGGYDHFCGLAADSTIACWGRGYQTPTATAGSGWSGLFAAAGSSAQCATMAGSVWCTGNIPGSSMPSLDWVQEPSFTTLALGLLHACGLHADGSLWCFGDNTHGQLGVAGTGGAVPQQVAGTWLEVAAGRLHTCAVASDHSLWCWGDNGSDQCGQPSTSLMIPSPKRVGSANTWAHVYSSAAADGTCAQSMAGDLACWGYDEYGELGDGGSPTSSEQPHPITSATDWTQVSVGGAHACGLRSGVVWCWGVNPAAGAGASAIALPTAVTGPGFVDVVVSQGATCALDANHQRWCWGVDSRGLLGDDRAWSSSFTRIPIP